MRVLVVLGLVFLSLQAAEVSISQSDFVARLINFVIFICILWYLGADKIKAIFTSRAEGFEKRFSALQEGLASLKQDKAQALQLLESNKQKALEIEALAKKEAYLIGQKVEEKLAQDVQNLNTSYLQMMELKEREILKHEIEGLLKQMNGEVKIQNPLKTCLNFLDKGGKQ